MDENHGQLANHQAETDVDSSLNDIMLELKRGETVVFDVGDNEPPETDVFFDTLVMKGFNVKKTFLNGRNTIIVTK